MKILLDCYTRGTLAVKRGALRPLTETYTRYSWTDDKEKKRNFSGVVTGLLYEESRVDKAFFFFKKDLLKSTVYNWKQYTKNKDTCH